MEHCYDDYVGRCITDCEDTNYPSVVAPVCPTHGNQCPETCNWWEVW